MERPYAKKIHGFCRWCEKPISVELRWVPSIDDKEEEKRCILEVLNTVSEHQELHRLERRLGFRQGPLLERSNQLKKRSMNEECQHHFVFVKETKLGIIGSVCNQYFFIRMCEKCGEIRRDQEINGMEEQEKLK